MGWPGGVTGVAGDFGTGPGGISVRSDLGGGSDINRSYDSVFEPAKHALEKMAQVQFDAEVLRYARMSPREGLTPILSKTEFSPTELQRVANHINQGLKGEMAKGLKDYLRAFEEADPIGLVSWAINKVVGFIDGTSGVGVYNKVIEKYGGEAGQRYREFVLNVC